MNELDAGPIEAAHVEAGETCEQCGKTYKNKGLLASHMRRIHGAPPSTARAKRDRAPKARASRPRAASTGRGRSMYVELDTTYRLLFQLWAIADPICGQVALQSVPGIAQAWDDAQMSSPAVRRVLESILSGSVWIGVALAHAPIAMVVATHHGPAARPKLPPPPEGWDEQVHGPWNADAAAQVYNNGQGAPGVASEAYGVYEPGSADAAR